ncbi:MULTISPECIES: RNA methyltransferase [unclassified Arenibacter]|jgi:TrmH family RNA methyltransferase|uniref:TrmH family RNA methyltransferase n=1 Tax=unclassified Arenibacter TaxID=2615047 RepID=UPI000E3409B4|nr:MULTISPECIES: RNA methyltransferase [unclassified Arenibacter]MCM4165060.1 RNA methyltransferase [Arenibacter sp. A80]RFT55462.1 RNA methyltransferase [Arenibacter sp. P308M17]
MVVKSQIKFIKNLQLKKYRSQNKLFVMEGIKTVRELLNSSLKVYKIYVTDSTILERKGSFIEVVSEGDLKKMSGLSTPNKVLGVFHIPEPNPLDFSDWVVALDDVRDPGNLGTIIRLCDWFGVKNLLCSSNSVDCYNPKVLQATMGSISRVNIVYGDLQKVLSNSEVPIYGAFMDGAKVYNEQFPQGGILVMGNEANGVSEAIAALVGKKISIPQFGPKTTESLNVATATAILLSEIRRG